MITGTLLQTLGIAPTVLIDTILLVIVSLLTTFNKHMHRVL
jgi:hypothetical protein